MFIHGFLRFAIVSAQKYKKSFACKACKYKKWTNVDAGFRYNALYQTVTSATVCRKSGLIIIVKITLIS